MFYLVELQTQVDYVLILYVIYVGSLWKKYIYEKIFLKW
jgi:hypothetical protein